jgi:cytochrome b subunit of formate dehydrogenase
MSIIGRRDLVEQVHVWCGIALPLPIVVSAVGYWGRGLRADAGRLDRWSRDDRTWLRVSLAEGPRRLHVRARLRLGKFNAGQKLNTAFTVGSIVIMLFTGLIMRFYHPWPLAWRTGATFVHDWLTVAIVVVVLGHVRFAMKDPHALRSIWRGTISREWATRSARSGWTRWTPSRTVRWRTDGWRRHRRPGRQSSPEISGRRPPGVGGPGPSPAR